MPFIKEKLSRALLPIARQWVRRSAPGRLRESLWRWGHWRPLDFKVETQGVLLAGNTLDVVQGYIYWFGVWEPNLTAFIKRRMEAAPDRVFVDVGANVGYFSALVARQCPQAAVVAIEAYPPTVRKLEANLAANRLRNVRVVAAAASDAPGTLEFFYAGQSNEGATTSVPGRFDSAPIRVQSLPFGDLLTPGEMAAARLIKIDVEGAEARVVKGLFQVADALPADVELVVEISTESAADASMIFEGFLSRGFYAYQLENSYEARSYLYPEPIKRPSRIHTVPRTQTDVVFSRVDAPML